MSLLAWLPLRPAGSILAAPGLIFDGLDVGKLAGESVTANVFDLSSAKFPLKEPPTRTVEISSRLERSGEPVRT